MAEVQLRLGAQVNSAASLDRTRIIVNTTLSHHYLLWSSWCMTKLISHTCGKISCRPVWYLASITNSRIPKLFLATTALWVSSSITSGQYVLNKNGDRKRLGSENNGMEGNTSSSHIQWHRWYKKFKTSGVSRMLLFSTRREGNEARRPHICGRPCVSKINSERKNSKSCRTQNTPRKTQQQPGDHANFETAGEETRHTRQPILTRFYISRVCGNRPRTDHAITKYHERV